MAFASRCRHIKVARFIIISPTFIVAVAQRRNKAYYGMKVDLLMICSNHGEAFTCMNSEIIMMSSEISRFMI